MEFNSQICTSIEQSERLLGFGLKRETADMMLVRDFCYLTNEPYRVTIWTPSIISAHNNFQEFVDSMTTTLKGISKQFVNDGYKPAWSLHRLIEMYAEHYVCEHINLKLLTYDAIIENIRLDILTGTFNKEYLEE